MKSIMNYNMSQAPTMSAPRASFNRSHGLKSTIDFDTIYPMYWDEVYPGDTFTMNPKIFARLATPLFPLIDNMQLDIHFFFVPLRQIWDNSKKFFGEQVNPGDSIDYRPPYMAATASTGYAELSIADYLGLPTKVPDYEHVSLYHRAYNHIYNEWYRDQNIIDSVTVDTDDGPDTVTDYVLLKRGKRHDYFTSCLVAPQKSTTGAVDLPLGTTAPVLGIAAKDGTSASVGPQNANETDAIAATAYANYWASDGASEFLLEEDPSNSDYPNVRVDLSNATAATILELRNAMAIQALLELDARAGTRYAEIVYSTFGVVFNDVTYRPEFLGGGSAPIGVNPVPSSYDDGINNTKGELGGFGTGFLNNGGFTKSFTEHGVLLGLVSARADITYQQGLDRIMMRESRYDYLYPILQNIGDQAVTIAELYTQDPTTDTGATGTPDNDRVFGYQERYAELKYKPSKITGLFRSNCTSSLEAWHLSEEFTSLPGLNQTFIEQNTPVDRAIVTASEPHLILDCYFNLQCARPMHLYSIPGMGSRF
jgi:hypothetical protein